MPRITIVPVPPSKCISDPLYDPRLVQSLMCFNAREDLDFREVIYQETSMDAAHDHCVRPSPVDLQKNYIVNQSCSVDGVREIIAVYDDVLTPGAHFVAMKQRLLEIFPEKRIVGFFLARRTFPSIIDEFDNL